MLRPYGPRNPTVRALRADDLGLRRGDGRGAGRAGDVGRLGEGNPLRNLLLCISVINVTFVGSARCTYWGDPPIPPVDE